MVSLLAEVAVPLDTLAGLVIRVEVTGQSPRRVRMVNVSSYVFRELVTEVTGYGRTPH